MTAGDNEREAARAFVFRLTPRRPTFALDLSDEERAIMALVGRLRPRLRRLPALSRRLPLGLLPRRRPALLRMRDIRVG